jgi:hypothetical protein
MVVLRQFLYRDDELVLQFLAQLEGGTYDEELVTEQNQSGGAFGGGVGAGPAKLSAERKKQGSWEASRTVRQTDESRLIDSTWLWRSARRSAPSRRPRSSWVRGAMSRVCGS